MKKSQKYALLTGGSSGMGMELSELLVHKMLDLANAKGVSIALENEYLISQSKKEFNPIKKLVPLSGG
ncbi:MAG: hypothetical protein ACFFD5_12115 [Candidatus Thorarchaeota archaeon]